MIELLKKTALTGIGVAFLTREKIEDFSREVMSKGKMSEQEGQKFVEEMVAKAEESKVALKTQIELIVNSIVTSMHLARAADVAKLEGEVRALRAELEAMRAAQSSAEKEDQQNQQTAP